LKISTEIKTGLIAIAAIAMFIWGYNFLKGNNLLSKQRVFYAVYNKVEGLNQSNPVLINGVKVGSIQEIDFTPDMSGSVLVKMQLTNMDFAIPKNTNAQIISADLLGSKAINLMLGNDSTGLAMDGDTLPSSVKATLTDEVNRTVEPIKVRALSLFAQLDSVISNVNGVLNEKTRDNLTASIESVKNTIQNLESTSAGIDTFVVSESDRLKLIFANIQSISNNLKENNDEISNIIKNISTLSDTLVKAQVTETIAETNRVLGQTADIMKKINEGQGSLGLLLNNDSLYNNLTKASTDLDSLFADMKKNPNRYVHFSVFGKKNKPSE